MKSKKSRNIIELDGSTGEGGGQLVRVAVALAAVTSQSVKIVNVRGNRGGPRCGGMSLLLDSPVDNAAIGARLTRYVSSFSPHAQA
jgi:RNA 3'-terminal phosphate cyclase (ATP)